MGNPATKEVQRTDQSEVQRADQSEGPVITRFLEEYKKGGYLAFGKVTQFAKDIVGKELRQLKIKYELYDRGSEGWDEGRAKAPDSARRTILRRQKERGQEYKHVDEIEKEMHDLAGIRIALYYPNDLEKVEDLIMECFEETKPVQDWPDPKFGPRPYASLDRDTSSKADNGGRKSKFPGYFARHYRVQLRLKDVNRQAAVKGRVLEIQLMSLLMHTWSKMHHELIYKPQEGLPEADEDDERLIDLSNGIIIAGEQLLRQIQINLDKKKAQGSIPFKNEQSFLSYWRQYCYVSLSRSNGSSYDIVFQRTHGYNVDGILYHSLRTYGLNTPVKVDWLAGLRSPAMYKADDTLLWARSLRASKRISTTEMKQMRTIVPSEAHESQYLLIALTLSAWFEGLEIQTLLLHKHNEDTNSPSRSNITGLDLDKTSRLVRYYVWLISNALRWFDDPEMALQKCREYTGDHPSPGDFLQILHPKSYGLRQAASVTKIRKFCEYLLEWDEFDWAWSLALSRLTWCVIPFGLERDRGGLRTADAQNESRLTICPKYFIDLLDEITKGRTLHGPQNRHAVLLPPGSLKMRRERHEWEEYMPEDGPRRGYIAGLERIRVYLDRPNAMEESSRAYSESSSRAVGGRVASRYSQDNSRDH